MSSVEKELIDLIGKNKKDTTVKIPMELAIAIVFELETLNRIRDALK